jgi:hypothetical protein
MSAGAKAPAYPRSKCNSKCNGKNKTRTNNSKIQGFFAALRMTTVTDDRNYLVFEEEVGCGVFVAFGVCAVWVGGGDYG